MAVAKTFENCSDLVMESSHGVGHGVVINANFLWYIVGANAIDKVIKTGLRWPVVCNGKRDLYA